jgi:hypothetical protein
MLSLVTKLNAEESINKGQHTMDKTKNAVKKKILTTYKYLIQQIMPHDQTR